MLMLSSGVASAQTITDGTNDVIKATEPPVTYLTGQTINEIDVKQITYTIEGTTLTLEYEIVGSFQMNGKYMYYTIVKTTDYNYIVSMSDGDADAMVTGNAAHDYEFDDPECVVGDNTLTAVFQTQGDTTIVEVFGWATFINNPVYQDWAPDNRGPEGSFGTGDTGGTGGTGDTGGTGGTGGNNTSGNGTPGFEAISIIAAIGLVFIILKRSK